MPDGAPISACKQHLIAAFSYCEDLLDRNAERAQREAKSEEFTRFHRWDRHRFRVRSDRVVYYAVVGQYIKIGTSCNVRARMQAIKADALLVTEPGGIDVEAKRHSEFRDLRAPVPRQKELFYPGQRLVAHINALRDSETGRT